MTSITDTVDKHDTEHHVNAERVATGPPFRIATRTQPNTASAGRRHTYATELANAGMSLQALMAVLGHVTPEMTLRYATLASPTLRTAYDQAIGKVRKNLPIAPLGRPIVPAKVDWIASEFLKTRLAHGYCSRHLTAGACPYANICETCDNFVPGPEHLPTLHGQLADIQQLRADAQQRGWTDETQRHSRVIDALETHCHRLENPTVRSASP